MLSKIGRSTFATGKRIGIRQALKGKPTLSKITLFSTNKHFNSRSKNVANLLIRSNLQFATSSNRFYATIKKFNEDGEVIKVYSPYLEPAKASEKLRQAISHHEYVVLVGAPGSGKSRLLHGVGYDLGEQGDVLVLMIDFHEMDYSNFWRSIRNNIRTSNQKKNLPSVYDRDDFINMFRNGLGQSTVLMLDHFDKFLLQAPVELRQSFLNVLSAFHQRRDTVVKSVVAAGSYGTHHLVANYTSAFTLHEPIEITGWSKEEVKRLLSKDILDEIIDDISLRTSGNQELVYLCANAIADHPSLGKDYSKWIQFATTTLMEKVSDWYSIHRMVRQISCTEVDLSLGMTGKDLDAAKLARSVLRQVLPFGLQPFTEAALDKARVCEYLAFNGALRRLSSNRFQISSPLVYTLLSKAAAVDQRKIESNLGTFDENFMQQLIKDIVRQFDPDTMKKAALGSFSNKEYIVPGFDKAALAPAEAVYTAELLSLLYASLPTNSFLVLPDVQTSPDGKNYWRVLIGHQNSWFAVLDICANTSNEALNDHIGKVSTFAKQLGANLKQAWVLHFTIAPTDTKFLTPLFESSNVNVVHIHHTRLPYKLLDMKFPDTERWL